MAIPRAFNSFEMQDCRTRDFLTEHAHNRRNDIVRELNKRI